MRYFVSVVIVLTVLVACTGGTTTDDHTSGVFDVYISGYETEYGEAVLGVSISEEDWNDLGKTMIDIVPTGRMTLSENGILVPSSGVIYEISNGSVSVVFEGDDVFKKAIYHYGSIFVLGEDGLVTDSGTVEGDFNDFCILNDRVFAVSDEGIEIIDLENHESHLMIGGNYTVLTCSDPYLYAGYDGGIDEFILEGENLSKIGSHITGFYVSSLKVNDEGIFAGGDGGVILFTFNSNYVISDSHVNDLFIMDDFLFVVSGMRNVLEIFDISNPSDPISVFRESLNLSNPSIIVERE